MKKILLASTALVLSAGIAQAQGLSMTGMARMGVVYNGGTWAQDHRLRLNFTAAVQADHGLSFGAFSRVQTTNAATATFSGSRVWVESNGLRLTFGNQDGAIMQTVTGARTIGYTGGTFQSFAGLIGSGVHEFDSTGGGLANLAQVSYTMGDYTVALSHQRGGGTELGVRATFDAFTVAAGYARNTTGVPGGRVVTVSANYNGGNWGAGMVLARIGATTNATVSGQVELGGGTATAYVGRIGAGRVGGVGYSYGLGGGASIAGGVERHVGGGTRANLGVSFSF